MTWMRLYAHILADSFHLTHFKSFRLQAINAVPDKWDTLVIQPIGSGKILCFQFPAVYTKTITSVNSYKTNN